MLNLDGNTLSASDSGGNPHAEGFEGGLAGNYITIAVLAADKYAAACVFCGVACVYAYAGEPWHLYDLWEVSPKSGRLRPMDFIFALGDGCAAYNFVMKIADGPAGVFERVAEVHVIHV